MPKIGNELIAHWSWTKKKFRFFTSTFSGDYKVSLILRKGTSATSGTIMKTLGIVLFLGLLSLWTELPAASGQRKSKYSKTSSLQ